MNQNKKYILEKISIGEEISPFLFMGENLELVNSQTENLAKEILTELKIPQSYLYKLEDNSEKIKIEQVKNFVELSNSKPPYKLQIFLIENISRLTLASSNSLLKFFEEPGVYNLILLTNNSQSWVLDTILSRVNEINLHTKAISKKSEFYFELIDNYINQVNQNVIKYFFTNKIEKQEYIDFLENIILYSKEKLVLIELVEEISEDINRIKINNVNPKYIVDKYLLKIWNQ